MKKKILILVLLISVFGLPLLSQSVMGFFSDVYNFESDKLNYQHYENIKVNATWETWYNPDFEYSYIQIQVIHFNDSILWLSQEYDNCCISMTENWTINIENLNVTFNETSQILFVKFYYYYINYNTQFIISTYRESIQIEVLRSGVYNLTIEPDKSNYNYKDKIHLNCSWTHIFNNSLESSYVQIELHNSSQIMWTSSQYTLNGTYEESWEIDLQDYHLNFSEYNEAILDFRVHFYLYIFKTSEQINEFVNNPNIFVIKKGFELHDFYTDELTYFSNEVINLTTSGELFYNPSCVTSYNQIHIFDLQNELLWNSSIFKEAGNFYKNFMINIQDLEIDVFEQTNLLFIKFFHYWYNNLTFLNNTDYYDSIQIEIERYTIEDSFETDKLYYQHYENIKVNAMWELWYNPDFEYSFMQVQVIHFNNSILWVSQEYDNYCVPMTENWTINIKNLNSTFIERSQILFVKFYFYYINHITQNIISTYRESIQIEVSRSGVYNLIINSNKSMYNVKEHINFSSSWSLFYNESIETSYIQFELHNNTQIMWTSNQYMFNGTYEESWFFNIQEFCLIIPESGMANVIMKVRFFLYNNFTMATIDEIVDTLTVYITKEGVDILDFSTNKLTFFNDEAIQINTEWELNYNSSIIDSYNQVYIFRSQDKLLWKSSKLNETGYTLTNWTKEIHNLELDFSKPTNYITIKLFHYWYDKIKQINNTDYIDSIVISTTKYNIECSLNDYKDNICYGERILIEAQFRVNETQETLFHKSISINILFNSSVQYDLTLTTDSLGKILLNLSTLEYFGVGINSLLLNVSSIETSIYNNTFFKYSFEIGLSPSPSPAPAPEQSINPLLLIIFPSLLVLLVVVIIKVVHHRKKLNIIPVEPNTLPDVLLNS